MFSRLSPGREFRFEVQQLSDDAEVFAWKNTALFRHEPCHAMKESVMC